MVVRSRVQKYMKKYSVRELERIILTPLKFAPKEWFPNRQERRF